MGRYQDVLILSVSGLALAFVVRALIGQAIQFLHEHEGPELTRLQRSVVAVIFLCTGMMLMLGALRQHITWADAGRYIVLLSWGVPMVLLDMRNCWLPFRYTTGFWLTGLLFTLLPSSSLTLTEALVGSGVMFVVLYGFRSATSYFRGEEGFGLGDVHLIAALCAWFPWQLASLLSGGAFLMFVVIALLTRKTAQPYAPWLFALLAVLAGTLPHTTI